MIPFPRACRQISSTGSRMAVGLVIWLRKITRVRGVTPARKSSTTRARDTGGRAIGLRT